MSVTLICNMGSGHQPFVNSNLIVLKAYDQQYAGYVYVWLLKTSSFKISLVLTCLRPEYNETTVNVFVPYSKVVKRLTVEGDGWRECHKSLPYFIWRGFTKPEVKRWAGCKPYSLNDFEQQSLTVVQLSRNSRCYKYKSISDGICLRKSPVSLLRWEE